MIVNYFEFHFKSSKLSDTVNIKANKDILISLKLTDSKSIELSQKLVNLIRISTFIKAFISFKILITIATITNVDF